jgi:branched-chain amino acid transport system ATP-binding protein
VHETLLVVAETAADPRPVEEMYVSFPTLDDFRDSRGHDLSGGEQQMLSVSVAESD